MAKETNAASHEHTTHQTQSRNHSLSEMCEWLMPYSTTKSSSCRAVVKRKVGDPLFSVKAKTLGKPHFPEGFAMSIILEKIF